MSITVEQLVQREVHACVSGLVSTLAQGYSEITVRDLSALAEQAFELAAPVPDYEEAATQEGWLVYKAGQNVTPPSEDREWWYHKDAPDDDWFETAQAACEANDISPYERDVYEHWVVSEWLAQRLECKGEKVDHDFAGLCVWARTTTGQAIRLDDVILRIHAKLVA
jgi:hypothetical protein